MEGRVFSEASALNAALSILDSYHVTTVDTAQLYGQSEAILGSVNAGDRFTIDTKWRGGFAAGSSTKETIIATAKESLERLKMRQVDIFYIHAPDASVPIADTLAGVNEVYKSGAFKRFGLSNYKVEDVRKVHEHCKERGYVLPTAYQGNYSPVARLQDTLLFPTLRELGMSFYAYSPLAGGFLTKTKEQLEKPIGRFDDTKPIGRTSAPLPFSSFSPLSSPLLSFPLAPIPPNARHSNLQQDVQAPGLPVRARGVERDRRRGALLQGRPRLPLGGVQLAAEQRVRRRDHRGRQQPRPAGEDTEGAEGRAAERECGEED